MISTLLGSLKFAWYQCRAPYVNESRLLVTKELGYTLEPIDRNLSRLMGFENEPGSQRMSALEASFFLKDFAEQDLASLENRAPAILQKAKEIDQKLIFLRIYYFFMNAEYRNVSTLKPYIKIHKERVSKVHESLMRLIQYTQIDALPVAAVSNTLYGAAKLNLSVDPVLNSILLPVLSQKYKYLTTVGLAETLWALHKLNSKNADLSKKILADLGQREVKYIQVVPGYFNHLQFQLDPNAKTPREVGLLKDVLMMSTDSDTKKQIEEFLSKYKPNQ
ncbi:unnamed protein product [Blepharisma stoltei]|uniref:Uncharacterized protein n=1 Tax=Blepharisma stoltei TaxID=1481888 RepID=A0AAU9JMS7_9CILI|nr:unnamed protein product [Blepharisma stoltei]